MAAGVQVNEAVAGVPAEQLAPFVAHYSGYRQEGIAPAEHRGLPSPFLTLIFTLHEPLIIAEHPDPRQPPSQHRTLVGGLHTSPALVTHDGRQSGVQIALSPLGARALLGVPAGELAIIAVEGDEVIGSVASQVHERLVAAGNWPDRFAILDEVLWERLRRAGPTGISPEVEYSWRRLLAAGGAMPIGDLVAETGWSDRHLRSAFASQVGLTPKAAARVIRFHRARVALQQRALACGRLDLAGLAAACGYYDQAHMVAEFRALAGSAPTTWLAREFRNFQASPEVPAEGSLL